MRQFIGGLTAALALACASCGSGNALHPVEGRVLYQSSPAVGATVILRREGGDFGNDHAIMGVVQDDGRFELVCGTLGKGAPAGEYIVLIEWPDVDKKRSRRGPDKLKGRYADPKKPRFHAVITAGRNELAPFNLDSAGPITNGQR